ncbi:MAG: hypothetical protein JRG92_13785 [Deltaproteobacteria bacterium]|nr:hypothetical protein [Deltaproteobacteria bacterium]MBW2384702.1 hypothetical protein [Deltaproteobacteria bacterium]MBW2696149.1 hypothetical protein [Deltaproteobacteria bacterium]
MQTRVATGARVRAGASAEPAPALTLVCDRAVVPFAGFTLLANATVAIGGGLDALITIAAVCGATAVGWAVWRRRSGAARESPSMESKTLPAPDVDDRTRIALLAAAVISILVYVTTGWLTAFVVCAGMAAAGALARTWNMTPHPALARAEHGAAATLVALSILCAVATAVAHRSDADDSFYVNLVVAAVDRPDAPLLAGDTLHGLSDIPMSLPVFKVLSWEMLQACIARVTGVDVLTLVHVIIPPLIAMLIPLAYARLLALLLPGRWPWALAVVVAVLLLAGDGKAGHAGFALLRLQQGKSVLLHVALPLISAYGIAFALRPDRRRFILLMSAQIAAVGLSSSGLWLAPAVAGLALVGAMPWPTSRSELWRSARTLGIGLAASVHALGLALLLRAETRRSFEQAVHRLDSLVWSGDRLVAHASDLVLGSGPYAWLALFCLPAALAAAPGLLQRRWAAVSLVAFFGAFWNPLTAPFVANQITGPDTYFRVFWLIPLPVFVATVLTAPLEWRFGGHTGKGSARVIATLVLVSLALLVLPQTRTLSNENGVRIARPGWKVDPDEMEVVVFISRYADSDDIVLAPAHISRWLPLLHGHPPPLIVREMYLGPLHERLGGEEVERRLVLTHLVSGESFGRGSAELLAKAIDDYPLEVVCLGGRGLSRPELRRVLLDSALEVRERGTDYEIWARGTMRP